MLSPIPSSKPLVPDAKVELVLHRLGDTLGRWYRRVLDAVLPLATADLRNASFREEIYHRWPHCSDRKSCQFFRRRNQR